MADSVISIGEQKFRKVKGVWIDQKKTPAPKDLIALLDKLQKEQEALSPAGEAKEQKPPLPVLPVAAKDFSTAKLEASINKLSKIVDKLAATIQNANKSSAKTAKTPQGEAGVEKVFEPGKIPTLKEAMQLNRQEFLHGSTNKYGETEKRGLIRDIKNINPFNWEKDDAIERRREAIGSELRRYEENVRANNPNMSQKDIDEKIKAKRQELENPQTAVEKAKVEAKTTEAANLKEAAKNEQQMKNVEPSITSSDEKEAARYISADVDKSITAVKITDIDESVLKRLADILAGKEAEKDKPEEEKPEESAGDSGQSGIGDLFDRNKRNRRRSRGRGKAPAKPEIVRDASGKARYAKGAVDPVTGKKLGGQFVKEAEAVAEQAPKKAGIFSKLFGEGAKEAGVAAEAVAEQAPKKAGIFSKLFGEGAKEAGVAAEAVAEQAPKKAGIFSKLFGGGAKAAEKEGVKAAEKVGIKEVGKIGAKALGKSFLKKIPALGILAGGAFAAQRALKGDFLGAGGELLSGIAGSIPVVGTAASVGIDAALAARDMGVFGGAPGEAQAGEAASANQPAIPAASKAPSKFASVAKALGKGALMATPLGLGALAVGSMLSHKKEAELTKPEVMPQTQDLSIMSRNAEAAKQQPAMAAGPTIINNNVSSPTSVSNNSGVINGKTVGDRGSLNLDTF